MNLTKIVVITIVFSWVIAHAIDPIDKRPCGPVIDKCISETRNTELGGCLGTAYGLYFAGEKRISNCKDGKYNSKCLLLDQSSAINQCLQLGPFPESCTGDVTDCILTNF